MTSTDAFRETETETNPVLVLENVSVGYGRRRVVRGATLKAYAGELVVLVGANGSGKSTLLRGIAGLLPAKGAINYSGKPITRLSPWKRSQAGIAMMTQTYNVFPHLSVIENLAIASGKRTVGQAGTEFDQCSELFPILAQLARRRAGLLSGGEKQALALCMALARNSKVLLLDEPTAGLAPSVAHDMMVRIRDICTRRDLAVIMVEHRLSEALPFADRVIVLDQGKLVFESLEPRTLLQNGPDRERLLDALNKRNEPYGYSN